MVMASSSTRIRAAWGRVVLVQKAGAIDDDFAVFEMRDFMVSGRQLAE